MPSAGENQGRELLELHGRDRRWVRRTDVLDSARILTGLSVDNEVGGVR